VLPLRLGLDPYGFIGKFQGYQIAGIQFATCAQEIVKILARHGQTALKMASALVGHFEESWSWDSAKATMSLLEECAVIDEALLTKIEEAGNRNSQVREAFRSSRGFALWLLGTERLGMAKRSSRLMTAGWIRCYPHFHL
jgi:hypothetical protein